MANTTNFGWETPDDTDLVKDGAAAIRTLAGAIDTSLVDLKGGTTNQVLAKNSDTNMDFKWVADASGIPATIFDAKGDLIVASAADTAARLAVGGTNGHVLTVNSSATNGIEWAAPAGGGKVLQVVYGSTSTSFESTTNSFADSGLTATITPSSTSSKVLVLINQIVGKTGGDTYIASDLLRNSTSLVNVGTFDLTGYAGNNGGSASNYIGAISASILDTPASTSALTYKTQYKNPNAVGSVRANQFALSTMILMEIGA